MGGVERPGDKVRGGIIGHQAKVREGEESGHKGEHMWDLIEE